MAISEAYTGTNASWGTNWSLTNNSTTVASQTTSGVYQLFLDMNALGSGDRYTVRVYEKVRSADTQRIVLEHVIVSTQTPSPNWALPAMTLMNGWDFTVLCSAGTTTRTITWSIRRVA